MRRHLLAVTAIIGLTASAAIAQESLIDIHKGANVSCQACHGEAPYSEPVANKVCTDCHGTAADLAAKSPGEANPHGALPDDVQCATCHQIHKK